MKRKMIHAVIAVFLVAIACFIAGEIFNSRRYRKQIDELKGELAQARVGDKPTIEPFRDSLKKTSAPVNELKLRQLERQHLVDKQLLKDLGLKIKQLEAVQTSVTQTEDTAKATQVDTVAGIYSYHDQWADLKFTLRDSSFYYNIRDSLTTFVEREYKHRFLWWRWGTKGYWVTHVNHNPNSHVSYTHYIKVEK